MCLFPRRLHRRDARLGWVLLLAGITAGLVATNPGPAAFEEFAGDRLAEVIHEEFCSQGGLPLMLRLVIHDCSALVRSQRPVLGRLAREHSHRYNLGLLSLYRTELGGQRILPRWRLPRYQALTLALAGQLVVLRAGEIPASGARAQASLLPGGSW